MESGYMFRPVKLEEQLNKIRTGFPSYAEYIKADHTEEIDRLLGKLSSALKTMPDEYATLSAEYADIFAEFAGTLKRCEVDLVLPALSVCKAPKLCSLLEKILILRFKRKLFHLNWAMLQSEYDNGPLLGSMKILAGCFKERNPDEYANTIFSKLDSWMEDLSGSTYGLLLAEGGDIRRFFGKYGIAEENNLGERVCELFFLKCNSSDFIKNRSAFTGFLKNIREQRFIPLFSYYLEKLETREQFDELNRYILQTHGMPGEGDIWGSLPESCTNRFLRWLDLKKLEEHFGSDSKSYRFWCEYFEHIRQIRQDGAKGCVFLDFGGFVVVDRRQDLDFSYLVDKNYFNNLMEGHGLATSNSTAVGPGGTEANIEPDNTGAIVEPGSTGGTEEDWRIIPEHVAKARDLIIENVNSPIYKIGYNRVNFLYLKEILDLKLK